MKKVIGIVVLLYSIVLVMDSCVASGNLPRLKGSLSTAGFPDRVDFVELNDGKIIESKILKNTLGDKNFGGGYGSIAIGGNAYQYREIKAYQMNGAYYFKGHKKQFIKRIVHGRINLYEQMINHAGTENAQGVIGHSSVDPYYYLQKGDDGKVVYFDIKTLRSMVKDYEPALEWMNKYNKLSKKEKRGSDSYFDSAIEVYNLKSN